MLLVDGKIIRECVLRFIPGEALGKGGAFLQFTCLQGVQILVSFQLAFGNLEHFHCHIGAVISSALEGSQKVFQHKAIFHGAKTIS